VAWLENSKKPSLEQNPISQRKFSPPAKVILMGNPGDKPLRSSRETTVSDSETTWEGYGACGAVQIVAGAGSRVIAPLAVEEISRQAIRRSFIA